MSQFRSFAFLLAALFAMSITIACADKPHKTRATARHAQSR